MYKSQGTKEAEGKIPAGAGKHQDSGYVIRKGDEEGLSSFPP